jgi:hypothetical protein
METVHVLGDELPARMDLLHPGESFMGSVEFGSGPGHGGRPLR